MNTAKADDAWREGYFELLEKSKQRERALKCHCETRRSNPAFAAYQIEKR
jgi:hypothetical protein